jgi:hypothetical protein
MSWHKYSGEVKHGHGSRIHPRVWWVRVRVAISDPCSTRVPDPCTRGFLAVYFGFFSPYSSVFLLTIGTLVISRLITRLILIQFSACLLTHYLKHGSNFINIGLVVIRVPSTPGKLSNFYCFHCEFAACTKEPVRVLDPTRARVRFLRGRVRVGPKVPAGVPVSIHREIMPACASDHCKGTRLCIKLQTIPQEDRFRPGLR